MAPNTSPLVTRQDRTYSNNSLSGGPREGETNEDGPPSSNCSDEFTLICLKIAVFLTNRKTGKRNFRCRYGEKMEKLTEDILTKHKMVFKGMTERLQLNEHNIVKSLEMTIKETFADGCNFGRVVTTYAFFVTVMEYCLRHGMDNKITKLQSVTANSIAQHKDWINRNGGWVR